MPNNKTNVEKKKMPLEGIQPKTAAIATVERNPAKHRSLKSLILIFSTIRHLLKQSWPVVNLRVWLRGFFLTLSRPGFFSIFWTGGGLLKPPLSNSENINTTAMKLWGCILRLKLFPLRSASWADDVTWRGNYVMISKRRPYWSAILDF